MRTLFSLKMETACITRSPISDDDDDGVVMMMMMMMIVIFTTARISEA
jgi:hypothetical protein